MTRPRSYVPGQKATRLVLKLDDVGSFDVVIRRLNARINIAKTIDQITRDIGRDIERDHLPRLLARLRTYPPRKKGMRIRWTSEKQRRYVMALLRAQAEARGAPDDIAYQRTGRLARGWKGEIEALLRSGDVIRIRVWNDAQGMRLVRGSLQADGPRYARFVQGRIGFGESRRSIERYRQPIQQFHTDRGWSEAHKIIKEEYGRMREYALAQHESRIEQAISRV